MRGVIYLDVYLHGLTLKSDSDEWQAFFSDMEYKISTGVNDEAQPYITGKCDHFKISVSFSTDAESQGKIIVSHALPNVHPEDY